MKTLILPFGGPAWGRRREILREIVSGRPGPPYDYGRVLYLTPNERKLRTLKVMFLDVLEEETGARGCIPPRFSVLNQFIRSHVVSSSRLPVVDDVTRGLVIEELCGKAAGRIGADGLSPEVVGPSLATPASDALDLLYLYGVEDGRARAALGDGLPARILMDVKRGYEGWLRRHGLADLAALKGAYRPGPDAFAGNGLVVIDGFHDADPCETRVLAALAASAGECHFLLEAPGLDRPGATGPGMPYFGTDRLMEAIGADIDTPSFPRKREPSDCDLSDATCDAEADAYIGALFAGRPLNESLAAVRALAEGGRDVTVAGALNPAEEVYNIAGEIKESYLRGELPDLGRVLVFFPSLDSYLPLVEESFRGLGIPYYISQGRPLAQSPVVSALMNILALPVDGYPFRGIRRVLSSPLVSLGTPYDPGGGVSGAFDAFARKQRIPGGKKRWLAGLEKADGEQPEGGDVVEADDGAALLRPVLTRLFEITAPLEMGRASLADWVEAVRGILTESGVAAGAGARAADMPDIPAARDALAGALDGLGDAASRLERRMDLPEFLYILRKALSGIRYSSGPDCVAGVRILGRLETQSAPFDAVYAGGLLERAMPLARPVDIFLPDGVRERLGIPASSAARSRDARTFLGLVLGAPKVTLCYPESSGGPAKSPSPYIRALEPFFRASRITRLEHVSRPLSPACALGPDGFLRALGIGAAAHGMDTRQTAEEACEGLTSGSPGCDPELGRMLDAALRAVAPRRDAVPPSPPEKSEFSVTELEEYLTCGYRYYQARVIRSAPEDEPDDDIAPHKAGSVVHDILQRFYQRHKDPVTPDNAPDALAALVSIADERFGRLPETPRNLDLRRRFAGSIAPRFIEAEAALSKTGYRVYATELSVRAELPDKDGGHVVITGKIDRIEMDEAGNFIVADYKTGKYPGSPGGKPLGRQFQLPLYACLVKKGAVKADDGRQFCSPAGLVYYNLKEGTMRDVVLYDAGLPGVATADTPAGKRAGDAAEVERVIQDCLDKALEAASGIQKGRFEADCEDSRICERCEFVPVCGRGERVADEAGEAGETAADDTASGGGDENV